MDQDVGLRRKLGRIIRAAMNDACNREMTWSTDNCAFWCANIYLTAFGVDPAWAFRKKFRTKSGAERSLPEGGLPAALRSVAQERGWTRIRPCDAKIGDLGIINTPLGPATVIRWRRGWWLVRNESGFSAFKSKTPDGKRVIRIAWSVV